MFGLAGTIGYIARQFEVTQVDVLKNRVIDLASQALTPDTVEKVITPTMDDVLRGGRIDVISIGFVLALWSGSRALNVFIDTISIMYGLGGHRSIVKTRALSFTLYVVALLIGIVLVPLVLAGPDVVAEIIPDSAAFLRAGLLAIGPRALGRVHDDRCTTCRCPPRRRGARAFREPHSRS